MSDVLDILVNAKAEKSGERSQLKGPAKYVCEFKGRKVLDGTSNYSRKKGVILTFEVAQVLVGEGLSAVGDTGTDYIDLDGKDWMVNANKARLVEAVLSLSGHEAIRENYDKVTDEHLKQFVQGGFDGKGYKCVVSVSHSQSKKGVTLTHHAYSPVSE